MTTASAIRPVRSDARPETTIELSDTVRLQLLSGPEDRHLRAIEQGLGVHLSVRGNQLSISGESDAVSRARQLLTALYQRLAVSGSLESGELDAAINATRTDGPAASEQLTPIRTRKRQIVARTAGQAAYLKSLRENTLTFGLGPAGTGKTYLAVAMAVDMLMSGQVSRIVLSRPAVEAGERLGFLPGDIKEKVDPYLRPLYDALHDMLPHDQVLKRLSNGDIEVAPIAFMRGRTLAHSFIILDEAQNTTPVQMKMFLTRLGEGSFMAITGDLSQIDLPSHTRSGLTDALEPLDGLEDVGIVHLTELDVVRHPLVGRIVGAYLRRDRARAAAAPA
jgi:phosphate starvation-inducible PhoH-like protein